VFLIFYFIYIALILCGAVAKKSKLYSVIIFAFLLTLFGLNNHHLGYSNYFNMDFSNYYTAYLSSDGALSSRNMETGFRYIMYLSNSLGLSMNSFRLVIGFFGFTLIINTIKRYSNYPNYVLSLYLIYPFINDVIQIRSFLAASIVIFSIRYLIENKKWNLFKYVLSIFIASSIHVSSLFYLVLILVRFLKSKNIFVIVFTALPTLVILAYTSFYPFLASKITNNEKVFLYLSRRTTWGLLLVFGILFMLYLVHYILNKECKRSLWNKDNSIINKVAKVKLDKIEFYDSMLKINTILLLIAPLLVYDFNFIRLYRNILPLNYIIYIDAIILNKASKHAYMYLTLIYVSLSILFMVFYGLHASEQIFPVFNDNILLRP